VNEPAKSEYMQGFFRGRSEGIELEYERIVSILKQADSTCAEWAIAILEGVDE
jgi:hypothetical protein